MLTRLLVELSDAYRRRFWNLGDVADLDRAVAGYRRAFDTARHDVAERANDLAVVLTDRYDVTGDPDDLAAATTAADTAVAGVQEGSVAWARYAATSVLCLWDRYDATGSLDDLDTAIDLGTRALGALSREDRAWARLSSNVGMLRMDRYSRHGTDEDLQEGVAHARRATTHAYADDPELGGWYNNLGSALLTRFGARFPERALPRPGGSVDLGDLEAAVAAYRKAIEESPWGVAGRATFLANLGNALSDLGEMYRLGGQPERSRPALREAADALAEAVSLTPSTAPYLASRLNVLGEAWRVISEETREPEDVAAARDSLRKSCSAGLVTAPEMTVAAADNWMRWAVRRSAWDEVGEADGYLLRAAESLHRAQSLRRHREAWLVAWRGLTQESVYALATKGCATDAAVRLERGRAVQLSEELGLARAVSQRLPLPLRHRYTHALGRLEAALRGVE
jgi:tetratricopeptide (TPR) repeat protein